MIDLKLILSFLRRTYKSDISCGVAIFILVDLIFRVGFSWNQNRSFQLAFDVPYRSHIWWATKDFLSQPKAQDIILLGASDMAQAVHGADAVFLNSSQDEVLKHRSEYLERRLENLNSQYKGVFCLAVPGEMPSDSYFTTRTLLSGSRKPKVIVLSIAPRSLCDATFGDPASSDVYKIMNKLGGTHDFESSCRSSLWDKLDYQVQQLFSIYGHKRELISWQHNLTQAVLSQLFHEDFSNIHTPVHIRKLALLELPEDYARSELVSMPFDPKHALFISNLAEYQSRYRRLKMSTFRQQLDFLKRLSELCRSEGISLVVINSPLTAENRQLIVPQVYALYLAQASQAVRSYGGTFVNLDLPEIFKHEDFMDSIHLNGRGGLKFLDHIALVLSTSSQVATSNHLQAN